MRTVTRTHPVYVPLGIDGWVVPGVRVAVADGVEPTVREPDKFGAFAWMEPAEVVAGGGAFPATVALIEALPT